MYCRFYWPIYMCINNTCEINRAFWPQLIQTLIRSYPRRGLVGYIVLLSFLNNLKKLDVHSDLITIYSHVTNLRTFSPLNFIHRRCRLSYTDVRVFITKPVAWACYDWRSFKFVNRVIGESHTPFTLTRRSIHH